MHDARRFFSRLSAYSCGGAAACGYEHSTARGNPPGPRTLRATENLTAGTARMSELKKMSMHSKDEWWQKRQQTRTEAPSLPHCRRSDGHEYSRLLLARPTSFACCQMVGFARLWYVWTRLLLLYYQCGNYVFCNCDS